ncbi:MAG: OmpA/MotB family protein [Terracidiphilus sp.]
MNPRPRKSHVSYDRWLVSYADFITLLFCFFVVLYAFSRASQQKQAEVKESVNKAFQTLGIFPGTSAHPGRNASAGAGAEQPLFPVNAVMNEAVLSPARVENDLHRLHRELAETLSPQLAAHTVSIQMGRDGLIVSLREAGFFDSGSATPKPETLPTLRQIAAALSRTPYDVRIEGHTDNIPIHNAEFDSNWELSSARATRIARLLIGLKAIPPDRISAAGYAQYHPVASNDTAQGRAANRRVDLVILPRSEINFAATEPIPATGPWRRITDFHSAASGTGSDPPSHP